MAVRSSPTKPTRPTWSTPPPRPTGASRRAQAYARTVSLAGLDVAFQPIVHLGSGGVLAYEALARPRHPSTPTPPEYFRVLGEWGQRVDGEVAAIVAAAHGFAALRPAGREGAPHAAGSKLFVNVSPFTMVDASFDLVDVVDRVRRAGVPPADLVIEITEADAVEDLSTLARRTARLRRIGVGLAIDDAGAGHASFRVITRLRPSFIKVDRDLVSGVDTDGARHAFLTALVDFARTLGSRLIAEGVETGGELTALAALGVEAGQGYLIARPTVGSLLRPGDDARRIVSAAAQRARLGSPTGTVEALVGPAVVVDPTTTLREAGARLLADPALQTLVIAARAGGQLRASGTLHRRALERVMAEHRGGGAAAERSVVTVADHQPRLLPADTTLRDAAAVVAAHAPAEPLDDLVVTGPGGALLGVVGVRTLLRALVSTVPRGTGLLHPVSGLFGGAHAEEEIRRHLHDHGGVTVTFVDLDGFRALNDRLGHSVGDDAIRATARCLAGVSATLRDVTVAHLGADDFVIVGPPATYEPATAALIRAFEGEVVPSVRVAVRRRATDELLDGFGLSIAGVELRGDVPAGLTALQWATEPLGALLGVTRHERGYTAVHATGEALRVSSWRPREAARRLVVLEQVDAATALRAVAAIRAAWAAFLASPTDHDRFPGPEASTGPLLRHADKVEDAARKALSDGRPTVDVRLVGSEEEILDILDRVAAVTQADPADGTPSPEQVLLQRLLRQRARTLQRSDRSARLVPHSGADRG